MKYAGPMHLGLDSKKRTQCGFETLQKVYTVVPIYFLHLLHCSKGLSQNINLWKNKMKMNRDFIFNLILCYNVAHKLY